MAKYTYHKCENCGKSINMQTSKRLALIWASYFGEPNSGQQGHCYLCPDCFDKVKVVLPNIWSHTH